MTLTMTTLLALTGIGFWAWIGGWAGLWFGRLFNRKLGQDYGYGFFFLLFLLPAGGFVYSAYLAKLGGI